MTAQENLLSKAPSGSERYRVDAAILDSGKLSFLPRLCLASYPTKPSEPRDQLLTICCSSRWTDGANDGVGEQKE